MMNLRTISDREEILNIIEDGRMSEIERRENNIARTPVKCVFYDKHGVVLSEVKKDIRQAFAKGRRGAWYGILYNLKGDPIDRFNYKHI